MSPYENMKGPKWAAEDKQRIIEEVAKRIASDTGYKSREEKREEKRKRRAEHRPANTDNQQESRYQVRPNPNCAK